MRYKKTIIILLIFLVLLFSGCTSFFEGNNTVKYPAQPTILSYMISYGYRINCSGSGTFKIIYDCDDPEVSKGTTFIEEVLGKNYANKTGIATFNDMKSWNISKTGICAGYELGITASIYSEALIVNDLTGKNALTLSEIKNNYQNLVESYCKSQGNKTTVFIDPNNPEIKNKAYKIYNSAETNNSFILSKKLFIWLKENTEYKAHLLKNNPQPASLTMELKTGDCDDLTYLYLSMCKSIDIPCRFIRGFLIYEDTAVPHAWAEVFVGGNIGDNGWIPVECAGERKNIDEIDAEVHQNFALESADHLRLFKDDGTNESLNISLSGISYMTDQNVDFELPVFFNIISEYEKISSKKLYIYENENRIFK